VEARALVPHPGQGQPALAAGAAEAVAGDLQDPAALAAAFAGVAAVYHMAPNMHLEEVAIAESAIVQARAAGARRFVYHSVLHPQAQAMPHHWDKLLVEDRLLASGLDYTILQPCAYMQNVLGYRQAILAQGVYPVPYSVEARLSMVDLEDVAEVAANVLTEPGHANAIYELAGPQLLSQVDVAQALSDCLGRVVRAVETPLAEWRAGIQASGMSAEKIARLEQMFVYYNSHGLVGNPRVLAALLGREPTRFADFLGRTKPTFCEEN
jgi:uncharacterized protein YbjT (DUF2867 family)